MFNLIVTSIYIILKWLIFILMWWYQLIRVTKFGTSQVMSRDHADILG